MLHRGVTQGLAPGWRQPFRPGRLTDGDEPKLTGGVVLQMVSTLINQLFSQIGSILSGIGTLLGGLL